MPVPTAELLPVRANEYAVRKHCRGLNRASRTALRDFGQMMRVSGRPVKQKTTPLNTQVGSAGGYTVPDEVALVFDDGLVDPGVFHARAWMQEMSAGGLTVPRLDLTAAHGTGISCLLAGLTLAWEPEVPASGATLTTTVPSFAGDTMKPCNLDGLIAVTNQLRDDGGEALGAYLGCTIALAVRWMVEYACFRGSGVGQPLGIVNSPAAATVTRQSASHVSQIDLTAMLAKLIPACFARAVWCCNPTALADLAQLDSYSTIYHPDEPRLCGALYGRPLYATEALPVLGAAGDVVLFDPGTYVIGRRSVEVELCDQEPTTYVKNQCLYRVVWRGNGQPLAKGTATLADGSSTAGTVVKLV